MPYVVQALYVITGYYIGVSDFLDEAESVINVLEILVNVFLFGSTDVKIMVIRGPSIIKILENMGESGSSYLLPIITVDDADSDKQYLNAYYRVNRSISIIGNMLDLGTKLTLYVARHTWAGIVHANNVAIGTISKAGV